MAGGLSDSSCVSVSHVSKSNITCSDSEFFCSDFKNVPKMYFSISLLSALSCFIVFLTYFLFKRLWGYSSLVFLFRTILDLVISVGHIVSFIFHFEMLESQLPCKILGYLFEFSLVSANLWYAFLAYDLIKAVRNPFGASGTYGWKSHLFVWTTSSMFTVILGISSVRMDNVGSGISMFYFCWISADTTVTKFATWSLFLYYLPHFILWCSSLIINLVAICILLGRLPASSETRRHIIKQNAFYVLILGIETTLIIPLWVGQLIFSSVVYESDHLCFMDILSLVLAYLFAFIHSLRGAVDLFVWWVTFSIGPRDFKYLFFRFKSWRHKSLYLNPENTLHTPLVGLEGSRVNKALRRDVIFCINYGILDAARVNAEEESQRTRLGSVRDPFMAHVMVKWEEGVHHQEAEERYNDPTYQEVHQRRIPFRPSNSLRDFSFIDIEPTVFGLLRNSYGLNPLTYQQSFQIKDDHDVESSGMLEKFTEGKSGSFFYFTRDFRYIIKTITSDEEAFLQKIAFRYYDYMQQNPNSIIVRLYGLHKVRLAREQRYISVVVMDNLFHNNEMLKMNERYDLKGSTISRRVLKGNEKPQERFKKTLKDLDLKTKIVIGPDAKAQLMEQLQKDVDFLSSLHIMDYSMLLGIHHHNRESAMFQRSMPIELEGGDDFTQVTFRAQSVGHGANDAIPLIDSLSTSPGSTLERGAALAQRRRTYSSVFGDDPLESSAEQSAEIRSYHIPWYRRDFGGLRSFSPYHPLNMEHNTGESASITLPSKEEYNDLDVHTLPNDTYFFGIVDILQQYNLNKKLENFTKTKLLCKDKDGISSVDEKKYAKRFLEAMDRIFM